MPDPLRKTISATEASALFEVSPYTTKWMLYRRFAHGEESHVEETGRMEWGKVLEPHILEHAARNLKFEVKPNQGDDGKQAYVRRGLLGCTRDAETYAPDRGPGVCEVKCVFDYRTWMMEWGGGNKVPRQYEIQVQTQMYVGDGEKPYDWGIFAVWIAGEVFYFERKPVPKFWDALEHEAQAFFADVKAHREPEPFGMPAEFPLLNEVFPIDEATVLDLRKDESALALAEDARMLEYHRQERLSHEKGEEAIKAKFRVHAKTAGQLLLPHGIVARLKQNKNSVGVKVHIPKDIPEGELAYVQ